MSDKPNTTTLPDGWRLFDKYQIRHTDGTPLKGKRYFVLRLDSDDPAEAARVAAAMSAYKGETQGNAAKLREAVTLLMDALADMITCNGRREKNRAAMDAGRTALAAPARNCDKFTNPFDAWLEWQAYCAVHKMAAMKFPPWLYDIAQESEVAK